MQVFFIRDGKLIGRDHFHVNIGSEDTRSQILATFLKQFYAGTPFIPRELMIQEDIEESQVIAEWLTKKRGQKVYIRAPKKGSKEKLVELAAQNASMVKNTCTTASSSSEAMAIMSLSSPSELVIFCF